MYSSYGTKLKLQVSVAVEIYAALYNVEMRTSCWRWSYIGQIYKVCKNKKIKTMLINKSK